MNKVTEEAEKVTEHALREEPETDLEAKERQGWMPVLGAVLALILIGALAIIFGLMYI